jgi:endonuclease/exonuclease/phosphatase family metal-dependent hydrolase
LAYLIALLVLWGAIHFDSGESWLITLFLFSPRWIVALPLLVLIPWTLVTNFRVLAIYALHIAIIVSPLMGFQLRGSLPNTPDSPAIPTAADDRDEDNAALRSLSPLANPLRVRLMSYNLGEGAGDVDRIEKTVRAENVQILTLQECPASIARELFRRLGWNHTQSANMTIGSIYSLTDSRVLVRRSKEFYNATVAITTRVQIPPGPRPVEGEAETLDSPHAVQIVCVHLPTFRPAFERAERFNLDAGIAIQKMGEAYREVAESTLSAIRQTTQPTVVAGDFNVCQESAYYRDYWSAFENAFADRGLGFGYTKYTRLHAVRIDHVIASDHWRIFSAEVGPSAGGDHRPVIAELWLK